MSWLFIDIIMGSWSPGERGAGERAMAVVMPVLRVQEGTSVPVSLVLSPV